MVIDNLWGYIGRSATLLTDDFTVFDKSRDTEITDFDAEVLVEEDVVKFDVTMENFVLVAMPDPLDNLPENNLGRLLIQRPIFLHIGQKVTIRGILHHDKELFGVLKNLQ